MQPHPPIFMAQIYLEIIMTSKQSRPLKIAIQNVNFMYLIFILANNINKATKHLAQFLENFLVQKSKFSST